jgi:hypothetical protein
LVQVAQGETKVVACGEQCQVGVVESVGQVRLRAPQVALVDGGAPVEGEVSAEGVASGGQEIKEVPRERPGGRLVEITTLLGERAQYGADERANIARGPERHGHEAFGDGAA